MQALSLRTRLVAAATLGVTLVLVAGGALLVSALRATLIEGVGASAALRSRDLAALAAQGDLPTPVPIGDDDEAFVQVVLDGRVVASSRNIAAAAPLRVDVPAQGVTRVAHAGRLPITDEEDDGGFVLATTSVGTAGGVAHVHVAASLEDVEETFTQAWRLGLLGLPVLAAVLGAGMWLLVGRALAPVDAIRAEAASISGSGLHRRVPEPPRRDEIGRLARTLNDMLGRLQDASKQQRRFVADAAHELRTPIASIRTTTETASRSTRPVAWDQVADDVLSDAVRMQQLTEQLLLLARLDAGGLIGERRPVDLDDVVTRVIADREPPATVDVELVELTPARVEGASLLLEQAVGNLLDNAVVHATSRVHVALTRDRGDALVTVDDDGPGIPEEHREAVLERFARLDEARTRDRPGGAGLGLAIVVDIVAGHDGTVTIADAPIGGARIQLRLPTVTG